MSNAGTVFRLDGAGYADDASQLHRRRGYPSAGLIQAIDGNFYGTTRGNGGAIGRGTVFKLDAAGTLTTLHSFTGQRRRESLRGLIQADERQLLRHDRFGRRVRRRARSSSSMRRGDADDAP